MDNTLKKTLAITDNVLQTVCDTVDSIKKGNSLICDFSKLRQPLLFPCGYVVVMRCTGELKPAVFYFPVLVIISHRKINGTMLKNMRNLHVLAFWNLSYFIPCHWRHCNALFCNFSLSVTQMDCYFNPHKIIINHMIILKPITRGQITQSLK